MEMVAVTVLKDKFVQLVVGSLVSVIPLVGVFFGFTSALAVALSFCLGLITFRIAKNYKEELHLLCLSSKSVPPHSSAQHEDETAVKLCRGGVCGDENCTRERICYLKKPWSNLLVSEEIDAAVESLLERTLQQYLTSWYGKLSHDGSFSTEIRHSIRYVVSVVLVRLLKVDAGEFVTKKIIPAVAQHVQLLKQGHCKRYPYHPAVYNRKAELDYLKLIVSRLLPLFLEPPNRQCRIFSTLVTEVLAGWLLLPIGSVADSSVINNLMLLLLKNYRFTSYPPDSPVNVEFLKKFVINDAGLESNNGALHPDLCTILKNQSLLYAFMTFLKDQGAVHILQFCLDVEDFNKRMLTPELSSTELDLLHRDAWDLYSVYFNPQSPDKIGFSENLVAQMRKIDESSSVLKIPLQNIGVTTLQHNSKRLNLLSNVCFVSGIILIVSASIVYNLSNEGLKVFVTQYSSSYLTELTIKTVLSKDVTKLRTSPPLFQAYEYAYGILDKNYCPMFHTSDEFYNWLCGPRTPASMNVSGSSSPMIPGSPLKSGKSKRNEGTVSKISDRLHKIKGAFKSHTILDGQAFDSDAIQIVPGTEFDDDLDAMSEEEERDLSSWKVKISKIAMKPDGSGKLSPTFTILVHAIEYEWEVERRITDFYALEEKLTEFHGDFPDSQLPPCGLLAPSPTSDPSIYEDYLLKLLNNPVLRGSHLLTSFLSRQDEFTVDDGPIFGRLLKRTVPLSLFKERGQNIEPFVSAFFSSTETKKIKQEHKEGHFDVTPRLIRSLTNTSFKDNLEISVLSFPYYTEKMLQSRLSGPFDALISLGVEIFKLPNFIVRLVLAFHCLLHKPIDVYIRYLLSNKIKTLLVPRRIAHLVDLLQWIIFEKHTKSNPKEVADAVVERISQLRGWSRTFYNAIFLLTQNSIMNKQLLYSLLDLLLEELFPEIK